MTHHYLKTWPEYFQAVVNGTKSFELRKNDRDFNKGDTITLQEWDPVLSKFTGGEYEFTAGYILKGGNFGLDEDYVIISIMRYKRRT